MTSRPDLHVPFEALPNPRGGSVRLAEMALTDALHAFQRQSETVAAETVAALKRAIAALHLAGWLPAQRFPETLALVVPLGDDRMATARASPMRSPSLRRRGGASQSARTVVFDRALRSLSRPARAARVAHARRARKARAGAGALRGNPARTIAWAGRAIRGCLHAP